MSGRHLTNEGLRLHKGKHTHKKHQSEDDSESKSVSFSDAISPSNGRSVIMNPVSIATIPAHAQSMEHQLHFKHILTSPCYSQMLINVFNMNARSIPEPRTGKQINK